MRSDRRRDRLYRAGNLTPITELPAYLLRIVGDRALVGPSQVFDTKTWRRLPPPVGRKYHPDLACFAPDGRFVEGWLSSEGYSFIDTVTEKAFSAPISFQYQPRLGWAAFPSVEKGFRRLPTPDHLSIPPDLLGLWLQVAVRGELDDQLLFVKWNESTWEKKRQELATKRAPFPDFPFPGHVAQDRLHWLRQEYETASEAEKPALAKQLLGRAESAGDQAEAARWRRVLTPKPGPGEPSASK